MKATQSEPSVLNHKEDQSGRTLLEMLGVLAIIGIITYGAIAGINYGMTSYKINQTYTEVQDIIQGIQDLYSWSKEYPAKDSMMEAACKNDVFSNQCDVDGTHYTYPYGAFGDIEIYPTDSAHNFAVKVYIPDATNRVRLSDMDWNGINISVDCAAGANEDGVVATGDTPATGYCTFSPK